MELPLYLSIREVQNKCEEIYEMHMTGVIAQENKRTRINTKTGLTNLPPCTPHTGLTGQLTLSATTKATDNTCIFKQTDTIQDDKYNKAEILQCTRIT
jgi:hypothetical protein